jgi:hypothetical protein
MQNNYKSTITVISMNKITFHQWHENAKFIILFVSPIKFNHLIAAETDCLKLTPGPDAPVRNPPPGSAGAAVQLFRQKQHLVSQSYRMILLAGQPIRISHFCKKKYSSDWAANQNFSFLCIGIEYFLHPDGCRLKDIFSFCLYSDAQILIFGARIRSD